MTAPVSSSPSWSLLANVAEPVSLPAALVPNQPSIPITTEQQVVEWENLQDSFVSEVGDVNMDLTDANNQARWKSARQQSDAMFRAKFGWQAFLIQNAAAGRQSGN